MNFWEVALMGLGLSADAFSVAVGKGLGMGKIAWKKALLIALFFGAFQALMPAAGYALGARFSVFVESYAPWIAFALLGFLGIKMILDAFQAKEAPETASVDPKELLVLAVATSLDALATGIVFAAQGAGLLTLTFRVLTIGAITFSLSLAGVWVGNRAGTRYNKLATVAGGVILVGIGLKILLEGME